jgi:hypothetical protein
VAVEDHTDVVGQLVGWEGLEESSLVSPIQRRRPCHDAIVARASVAFVPPELTLRAGER